ncbi:hypothetical protein [Actinomadura sp. NPDC048394]|uniref:hypothetical protein n=1 Tax=Actinomadura sp. NPDC048394 TaxID=3158223 RepID=UPI0033D74304
MIAKEPFTPMTPEQLDYWLREIRPLLVRMREQSEKRARQQALALIRQPLRNRPTGPDAKRVPDGTVMVPRDGGRTSNKVEEEDEDDGRA